ncbi:MAG: hypothetical protein MUQ56_11020, partial [Thermoleophilia bacterium]|nr:hypothetical protein [Thermoleophilia bacterium]
MQGFRAVPFFALGLLLACVCGCNKKERTNFSHIAFEVEPVVQSRSDPSIPLSGYRTFTVWCNPQSSDPLLERQLLSIARSMLEAKGYQFVTEVTDADMVMAIGFDNQYREIY